MQKHTKIRRCGGSLGCTIPNDFVNIFGLVIGDSMHWEIADGRVTVEFFKVARERQQTTTELQASVDT